MTIRKKMLCASIVLGLALTGCKQASPVGEAQASQAGQTSARAATDRATISDAERSVAALEVQNVMSKHAYYHSAGMNSEEVDALWVDPKGPNAATATFASPMWVMNGLDTVKRAYGEENQRNRERALEALSKLDPSVENKPENLGAGHEWVIHTLTTPVIEIAGDGKTAKAVWYSPGVGLMTDTSTGEIKVQGTFFWEKYGADFIKEGDEWKIWHLQMAYDFTPRLDDKWLDFDSERFRQAGERVQEQELPPGFSKPKYSYPAYSPQRPGIIYPPLPEKYYTFSETFTY